MKLLLTHMRNIRLSSCQASAVFPDFQIRKLINDFVFVSVCLAILVTGLQASTLVVSSSGTFDAGTPSSAWTLANASWSFDFTVDSDPVVTLADSEGLTVAVGSFSYLLNGSSVSTTPSSIRFFNSPSSAGMFNLNFVDGGLDLDPTTGFEFFGPQLFSGSTASPTIIPGVYTATGNGFFLDDLFIQDLTGTIVTVSLSTGAAETPEPATWVLTALGLAVALRFKSRVL